MWTQRHVVTLTTDALGDAVGYTPTVTGRVWTIVYRKTDFADGVDFTITNDTTGETIWAEENVNASAVRAPRVPTHEPDGDGALYAPVGEPVVSYLTLVRTRVKLAVANGGAARTGTFHVVIA
jgi:hypothetical protein